MESGCVLEYDLEIDERVHKLHIHDSRRFVSLLHRGPKRFISIKRNVLLFTCVSVSF